MDNNMKKSLYTVGVFVKINTKRFFRDKLALFFTVGFPLIFLIIFGSLNSGTGDLSFDVALINQSDNTFAREFTEKAADNKVLNINKDVKTLDQAKEKMSRSELDAVIVLPENFGANQPGTSHPGGEAIVIYTQNNEQSGRALGGVLNAQFSALNAQFVKNETPFTVSTQQLNERSL